MLIVKLQELYAEHHPEGTDAAEPEPEPEPVRLLQTKNIPTDSPRPSAAPRPLTAFVLQSSLN